MDPGYSIEEQGELTVVRFLRELSLDETIALIEEFASRDIPHKRLWVFGRFFRYTPEAVTQLGDLARSRHPQPGKVAYVADDDVSFGLTNVLAAYREIDGFEYMIFRDEESALGWLHGDADG